MLLAMMLTMQAKAGCSNAGAIDGTCMGSVNKDANYNGDNTVYGKSCGSAGALGGMCYDKPHSDSMSISSMSQDKPKTICYKTGALSGMCF